MFLFAFQGDAIAHFPPGAVPLRSPHDLPPGHYMHPHVMPYPIIRPKPYPLPRYDFDITLKTVVADRVYLTSCVKNSVNSNCVSHFRITYVFMLIVFLQ